MNGILIKDLEKLEEKYRYIICEKISNLEKPQKEWRYARLKQEIEWLKGALAELKIILKQSVFEHNKMQ